MRIPPRLFALVASPAVVVCCLLALSGEAAHAEMTDPPLQADIDSSGGGFVSGIGKPDGSPFNSFDRVGSVPPGYEVYTSIGLVEGRFFYQRDSFSPVRAGELSAFNSYKGANCMIEGGGSAISCSY